MKNGNFSEWSSLSAAYPERASDEEVNSEQQKTDGAGNIHCIFVLVCFALAIVSGWLGLTDFMRILLLCGGFCLVA